jgi:hypothetical protein
MIRIGATLGLGIFLFAPCAEAQDKSTKYVRIVRVDGEPVALQTSIARFVPAKGDGDVRVDLISVIHFGEKSYYRDLDMRLAQYDALLYELVAPEGHAVPPKGSDVPSSPFRIMQRMTQSVLGLAAQLDHIDYTRKNFVHADLSPAQMMKAMAARGEDGVTLALGITADLLRQYNLEARRSKSQRPIARRSVARRRQPDLLSNLLEPGGISDLKRQFAEQLVRQAAPDGGLGRTLGTILVDDRNKAAMRVFGKELAKGKRRIGIFYGAAHMPDFERRLVVDFGMKKTSTTWATAWDLRKNDETAIDRVFETLLREAMRGLEQRTPRAKPAKSAGKIDTRPKKKRRRKII